MTSCFEIYQPPVHSEVLIIDMDEHPHLKHLPVAFQALFVRRTGTQEAISSSLSDTMRRPIFSEGNSFPR